MQTKRNLLERIPTSPLERPFALLKNQRTSQKALPTERRAKENVEDRILEVGQEKTTQSGDQIYNVNVVEREDMKQTSVGPLRVTSKRWIIKIEKTKVKAKRLVRS